eukprot:1176075-Prorocentrum_minimum.AAC.4
MGWHTWAEDAAKLAQASWDVRHVAQTITKCDGIERVVRKGKRQRVALHPPARAQPARTLRLRAIHLSEPRSGWGRLVGIGKGIACTHVILGRDQAAGSSRSLEAAVTS